MFLVQNFIRNQEHEDGSLSVFRVLMIHIMESIKTVMVSNVSTISDISIDMYLYLWIYLWL